MVSNLSFPEVVVAVVVGCLLLYFFVSGGGGGGGDVKKTQSEEAEEEEDEGSSISMPKGDLTVAELKKYDGSDPSLPVLVAAKGRVYDMTKGRDYYGRALRLCFRIGPLSHPTQKKIFSIPLFLSLSLLSRHLFFPHRAHPRVKPTREEATTTGMSDGDSRAFTFSNPPYIPVREVRTTASPASIAAALWPR